MHTLLAIDDDREMLELLAEYLKPEGFLIEPAHTAEEGLERASKKHYDLILLDVMLPGINGFEALRRLRRVSQRPPASGRQFDVRPFAGSESVNEFETPG